MTTCAAFLSSAAATFIAHSRNDRWLVLISSCSHHCPFRRLPSGCVYLAASIWLRPPYSTIHSAPIMVWLLLPLSRRRRALFSSSWRTLSSSAMQAMSARACCSLSINKMVDMSSDSDKSGDTSWQAYLDTFPAFLEARGHSLTFVWQVSIFYECTCPQSKQISLGMVTLFRYLILSEPPSLCWWYNHWTVYALLSQENVGME